MSRKKRKTKAHQSAQQQVKPTKARRALNVALLVLLIAALAVLACLVFSPKDKPDVTIPSVAANTFTPMPTVARNAKSLEELLKMTPEQLADVDIAEMNLLCATGLPGAEKLDIDKCLARLDQWAARVKFETQRHLYRAHDPRWADHYKHSENWLRAELLAQVLQQDCGVHYNMERIRNIDFTKSKDLFIHGMIDDDNGGTCVSMPVMYVAVGRRLGYPLKLVLTKGHVLSRWDDTTDRFNIETTSNGGTDSFPDEHYKTWPMKWTKAEAKANYYLKSLSPAEELGVFLASRGHCLLDNGRTKEAFNAYAAAHRLAPKDPAYLAWARLAERRLKPPNFARTGPRRFREPPMVYRHDPFAEVERINGINRAKIRRLTQPPTPIAPQSGMPQPHRPPVPGQPQR